MASRHKLVAISLLGLTTVGLVAATLITSPPTEVRNTASLEPRPGAAKPLLGEGAGVVEVPLPGEPVGKDGKPIAPAPGATKAPGKKPANCAAPGQGGGSVARCRTAMPDPKPVKPAPATRKPVERQINSAPPGPGDEMGRKLLVYINQQRAAQSPPLPPYTMLAGLVTAAKLHNDRMARPDCGMSHQCPGEDGLDRFRAQGVDWRGAGENVGQGSASNNEKAILDAAIGLTDLMLAEKPPNDGHRKNLLSSGFTHIGIHILRDGEGKVWLTQDFASF